MSVKRLRKALLSIAVSMIVGITLAVWFENYSIFFFTILSWDIIVMVDNHFAIKDENSLQSFFVIWLVLIAVMLFVYYAEIATYGLPYIMSDDYKFDYVYAPMCIDNNIYTIEQMNNSSLSIISLSNCKLYFLFLASIQRLALLFGGYHTIDIRLVNISCLIITTVIVNRIALEKFGISHKNRRQLILLMTLLPNIAYLTCHVYRDVYVMLLLVALFYEWNRIKQKNIIIELGISSIICFCLYYFRSYSLVYGVIIVGLGILEKGNHEEGILRNLNSKKTLLLVTFFAISVVYLVNLFQSAKYNRYIDVYTDINTLGSGMSSIAYNMKLLPFGWIARCFVFLISPFYPQIVFLSVFNTSLDLVYYLITVGTCILFMVFPYAIKRIKKIDSIVVVFLVLFISSAVVTSGFRHILMSYPFLFLTAFDEKNKSDVHTIKKNAINSIIVLTMWLIVYIVSRLV